MGSEAEVLVVADDPDASLDHAGRRLAELEARWSRFRPDSELSGLNRAAGGARRCSADTVRLVEELVRAWHATEGAFDPTLLGALVELGYAASRTDASLRTSLAPGIARRGRPDQVRVDQHHGVVQLPAATALDPGGLGKGLAADLIVGELLELGAEGAMVSVGGDVRVAGMAPADDHWPIVVQPTPSDPPVGVAIVAGGVATSSSRLRTWRVAGAERHHLVDPTAFASTDGDVVACTVVAGTAAWAEAFTKVAFVQGAERALEAYAARGLAARMTLDDGRHVHSPAWQDLAR